MLAFDVLTRKSRLACFPATFSLASSCSLMVLLDFLPFLDRVSCSSMEVSVFSSVLILALDRVIDPSEVVALYFLSPEFRGPSSWVSFS